MELLKQLSDNLIKRTDTPTIYVSSDSLVESDDGSCWTSWSRQDNTPFAVYQIESSDERDTLCECGIHLFR